MAINKLTSGTDSLTGSEGNDVYIVFTPSDYLDSEIIDAIGTRDEIRFASTTANETLILFNDIAGIEQVVIGTGTGKSAVTSGKKALNVDASNYHLNGLSIKGNAGNNSLVGSDQIDVITAGAGNDTLQGGLGSDTLIGGTGNDTYVLTSATQTIKESLDAGNDTVQLAFDGYTLGANLEKLLLTGSSNLNANGNKLNNTLTGNSGANVLNGGAGNDTLIGGGGNDTLIGGTGKDTAQFSGSSIDYVIKQTINGYSLEGMGSTTQLEDIEFLKFGDAKPVKIMSLFTASVTENSGIATVHDLVDDPKWGAATLRTDLKYSFTQAIPSYDTKHNGFRELTTAEQNAVTSVLKLYENISNLRFTLVTDSNNANQVDLRYGAETQASGLLGYAYLPIGDNQTEDAISGDVWLSKSELNSGGVAVGSLMYSTIIHETGHALGLKHTGNYGNTDVAPFLPASLDNNLYSIMSYNPMPHNDVFRIAPDRSIGGSANTLSLEASTPMLLDIAAIQSIYGANMSYHNSADNYQFEQSKAFYTCIWDGGGEDTIDTSNYTRSSVIDLREGHFSSLGYSRYLVAQGSKDFSIKDISELGLSASDTAFYKKFLDTYHSFTYTGEDNLSIAYGAVIENATGGSGNDDLIGNSVANILLGGAGNDTISGWDGADTISGNGGNDLISGGNGNDVFLFDSSLNAASNIDTITDFKSGVDVIELDQAIFSAFSSLGSIAADAFNSGSFSTAQDASDRIIYDTLTGGLYYDFDGLGSEAAIQFARLSNFANLSFNDFVIV